jgi:predicted ester cyclase
MPPLYSDGDGYPAAVTAQFAPLISAFPDWHWDMRHIVVDDENIVAHFTVTGTHQGTFQGIEATGRRVAVTEFTHYHLEDGMFAEVWICSTWTHC